MRKRLSLAKPRSFTPPDQTIRLFSIFCWMLVRDLLRALVLWVHQSVGANANISGSEGTALDVAVTLNRREAAKVCNSRTKMRKLLNEETDSEISSERSLQALWKTVFCPLLSCGRLWEWFFLSIGLFCFLQSFCCSSSCVVQVHRRAKDASKHASFCRSVPDAWRCVRLRSFSWSLCKRNLGTFEDCLRFLFCPPTPLLKSLRFVTIEDGSLVSCFWGLLFSLFFSCIWMMLLQFWGVCACGSTAVWRISAPLEHWESQQSLWAHRRSFGQCAAPLAFLPQSFLQASRPASWCSSAHSSRRFFASSLCRTARRQDGDFFVVVCFSWCWNLLEWQEFRSVFVRRFNQDAHDVWFRSTWDDFAQFNWSKRFLLLRGQNPIAAPSQRLSDPAIHPPWSRFRTMICDRPNTVLSNPSTSLTWCPSCFSPEQAGWPASISTCNIISCEGKEKKKNWKGFLPKESQLLIPQCRISIHRPLAEEWTFVATCSKQPWKKDH